MCLARNSLQYLKFSPDDAKYLAMERPTSPLLTLGSSFHHWEFLLKLAVDKLTVNKLSLLYFGFTVPLTIPVMFLSINYRN
jgi:hypothetical protein